MAAPEGFISDAITPTVPAAPTPAPTAPAPTATGGAPTPAPPAGPEFTGLAARMTPKAKDAARAMSETRAEMQPPDPTTFREALFSGAMLAAPLARLVPYVAKLPLPVVRMVLGAVTNGTEGAVSAATGEVISKVAPGAMTLAEKAARKTPVVGQVVEKVLGQSPEAAQKAAAAAGEAKFASDTAFRDAIVGAQKAGFGEETAAYKADVAGKKAAYAADKEAYQGAKTARREKYAEDVAAYREQKAAQKAAYTKAWQDYRGQVDTLGRMMQEEAGSQMSREVGGFISGRVPTLGNRNTAQALDELKQKGTKALVGEYFANKVNEAEGLIGGPQTTIRVPALRKMPTASAIEAGDADAMAGLKSELIGPGGVKIPIGMLRPTGAGAEDFLKMQQAATGAEEGRMTLATVVDKLAALRLAAKVSNDPAERTVAGKAARTKMGEALNQVREELESFTPQAWEAFSEGRKAYAFGSAMIDLMRKDGVFTRNAETVQLNVRKLQELAAKHRGSLEERLGPSDYREFVKILQRGGALGLADVPAKPGQLPQFVGQPRNVLVPPQRPAPPTKPTPGARPIPPTKPTFGARPTAPTPPGPVVAPPPPPTALPPTLQYPVDLQQAYINSGVFRLLPPGTF